MRNYQNLVAFWFHGRFFLEFIYIILLKKNVFVARKFDLKLASRRATDVPNGKKVAKVLL